MVKQKFSTRDPSDFGSLLNIRMGSGRTLVSLGVLDRDGESACPSRKAELARRRGACPAEETRCPPREWPRPLGNADFFG